MRLLAVMFVIASNAAAKEAPLVLSQTGLYRDIVSKTVDPLNAEFEPQFPLWTDGAAKRRWIRIPAGTRIDINDIDRWVFPIGTRFWKEFSFRENGNAATPRRVETRYIEKTGVDDWLFAAYVWNEDELDAALAPKAGIKDHFPIGSGARHDIPGLSACVRCHTRGGDRVLGFDAIQLSAERDGLPTKGLTLQSLAASGLLTRTPERQPRIFASSSAARRSMGYVHGNCGHCHNPQGGAGFTELFLRHQIEGVGREADEPAYATTVNKRTRFFQIPGQSETYRIKAGGPSASAVLYRMRRRGDSQMPPIGSKIVDNEATDIVLQWIQGLLP